MTVSVFVNDMKEIRRKAREHLSSGAVTPNYQGNVEDTDRPLESCGSHGDRMHSPL